MFGVYQELNIIEVTLSKEYFDYRKAHVILACFGDVVQAIRQTFV